LVGTTRPNPLSPSQNSLIHQCHCDKSARLFDPKLRKLGYRDVVGGTRDFARNVNGTQDGDPRKAAAALDAALDAPVTPLRLQLGTDAVDAIRDHSETLLRDLATWEDLARATSLNSGSGVAASHPRERSHFEGAQAWPGH
jgi:hypothetical protein